jgi:myo-inositol 2-dehydrogenase/D-chiro-inositol 1-dehydrogenase
MSAPTAVVERRVRAGIAGLGRLGMRHAENLRFRVPEVELLAACSPVESERSAAHALGVPRLHSDYAALLADGDIDAVFLVTPTSLHAEQIVAALEAGKHVFCEKPLALNLTDCLRAEAAAARRPDLVVMIGFVRRFDPSYRDAAERIAVGEIGRPYFLRSQTADKYDASGFFVRFARTSGGIFLDCTIHDIDLARWLLGAPRPVRAWASGTIALHEGLREYGDVDNGVATVEYAGGELAAFFASRTLPHGLDTHTEVFGTAGGLAVGLGARANRVDLYDERGMRHECTPDFYARFHEAFVLEAQAFARAVRDGGPSPLPLSDATEATRVAIAIGDACRQRRMVEIEGAR